MKVESSHQTANLLQIHRDSFVLKDHVALSRSLLPAAFFVSGENELKVCHILLFSCLSGVGALEPVVVSGPADAQDFASSGIVSLFFGSAADS